MLYVFNKLAIAEDKRCDLASSPALTLSSLPVTNDSPGGLGDNWWRIRGIPYSMSILHRAGETVVL